MLAVAVVIAVFSRAAALFAAFVPGPASAPSVDGLAPIFEISGAEDCSVNYRDELRADILRETARVWRCTIEVPDSVTGRMDLKLAHVGVWTILDAVLRPLGLSYFREGDVIKIVDRKVPEPVVSVRFQLSFIEAEQFSDFCRSQGFGAGAHDRMEFDPPFVTVWTTWRCADRIKAYLVGWDLPRSRFRGEPRLPTAVPPEVLNPVLKDEEEIEWAAFEAKLHPNPEKRFEYEFYFLNQVDARLVAKRIQPLLLPGRDEIVVMLCRNSLLVRTDRKRLQAVSRAVRYLDDVKWYPARPTQADAPVSGGSN